MVLERRDRERERERERERKRERNEEGGYRRKKDVPKWPSDERGDDGARGMEGIPGERA